MFENRSLKIIIRKPPIIIQNIIKKFKYVFKMRNEKNEYLEYFE